VAINQPQTVAAVINQSQQNVQPVGGATTDLAPPTATAPAIQQVCSIAVFNVNFLVIFFRDLHYTP